MDIEVKKLSIFPPAPNKCQQCAVEHDPEMPHDATSLYYGFWFTKNHGRSPTWNDAMDHCPENIKEAILGTLQQLNIDPASTKVRGDITSQQQVEDRLRGDSNA